MAYWARLLWHTGKILLWPDHWSLRVWRWPASMGLGSTIFLCAAVNKILDSLGYQPWPFWYYFVVAAVAALFGLAFRVAELTTTKIAFGILRNVPDDNWNHINLPVKSVTTDVLRVRCSMRILRNGEPKSIDGRDIFVPVTTQRLVGKEHDAGAIGRFNIDDTWKDIELFRVSAELSEFRIGDELSEMSFEDAGNYQFEITVTGETPASTAIVRLEIDRTAATLQALGAAAIKLKPHEGRSPIILIG